MKSLLIIVLGVMLNSALFAQKNNITLVDVIQSAENTSDLKFSYDPQIISLIQINAAMDETNTLFVLDLIQKTYPIKVFEVSPGFFSITLTKSTYSVILTDSAGTHFIDPISIQIGIGNTALPTRINADTLQFDYLPKENEVLKIQASGYQTIAMTFQDLINQRYLDIKAKPLFIELPALTISQYLTTGIDLNPTNQVLSIKTSSMPLLPGETDGDVFASILALPGITSPDTRSGNLMIRGNATDQSLILFDDIPIYHRGHFYGTISPFNPKAVDQIDIYRNGYPANYSGRVGGLINIQSEQKPLVESESGVGLNSMYAMAYTKQALNRGSLSLSARRSLPSNIGSPKLEAISNMVFDASSAQDSTGAIQDDITTLFEDYHLRYIFQPNTNHQIALSGLFSRSKIEFPLQLVPVMEQSNTLNKGGSLKWIGSYGENWQSELTFSISNYQYRFSSTRLDIQDPNLNEQFAINTISDISIGQGLIRNIGHSQLQFGLTYQRQEVNVDYNSRPTQQQPQFRMMSEQQAHQFSPSVQLNWNEFQHINFQLGIQTSYFTPTSSWQWSPRFLINYDLHPNIILKASSGKYYQYLSQVKFLNFGNGGFDNEQWNMAQQNEQIMYGWKHMLGFLLPFKKWIVDVEFFSRDANQQTYYSRGKLSTNGNYLSANENIIGLDFFVKRKVQNTTDIWSGYSYGKSNIQIMGFETFSSKYLQPHVFYLGGATRINQFKCSVVWKYGSGLNANSFENIIAQRRFESQPNTGGTNPFENRPSRYAAMHQLDLSMSYIIPKSESRNWTGTIGLSLINSYNEDIQVDAVQRISPNSVPVFIERQGISFAPNLMLTVSW